MLGCCGVFSYLHSSAGPSLGDHPLFLQSLFFSGFAPRAFRHRQARCPRGHPGTQFQLASVRSIDFHSHSYNLLLYARAKSLIRHRCTRHWDSFRRAIFFETYNTLLQSSDSCLRPKSETRDKRWPRCHPLNPAILLHAANHHHGSPTTLLPHSQLLPHICRPIRPPTASQLRIPLTTRGLVDVACEASHRLRISWLAGDLTNRVAPLVVGADIIKTTSKRRTSNPPPCPT